MLKLQEVRLQAAIIKSKLKWKLREKERRENRGTKINDQIKGGIQEYK